MKKTASTVAALTLALGLTACGITGESDGDSPRGSNTPSSSDYTQDPALIEDGADADAETADSSDGADNGTTAFGGTYTYEDGLSVSVSQPKTFTRSQWAAGGESHNQHVKFTVRIVNKTGAPFDPSMATLGVQSGGTEGDEVFDSDVLGDPPMTQVLDGREVSYEAGFGVSDPADVLVQVSPSFEYNPSLFESE